jgi:hypothetical protein
MNRECRETTVERGGLQACQAAVDTASACRTWQQGTTRTSDSANPNGGAGQLLSNRFRCPENGADLVVRTRLSHDPGYFQLGRDAVCYGQCSFGRPAKAVTDSLHDAVDDVVTDASSVHLPFDPVQIIDNLRRERYRHASPTVRTLPWSHVLRSMYYAVRPALGVSVRRHFQKAYFRGWDKISFPRWPVDTTVESIFEQLLVLSMKSKAVTRVPFIWFWPEGAPSCTIMTHDVETLAGLASCPQLMDLDDSFQIKSSFQIVPEERYTVLKSVLATIRKRGFEVNVHDLNHDGRLMNNRKTFLHRVERINRYGQQFGALGFRSAVMYRNIDWHDALKFSYDMSIPNVGHLEAQRGGCCTVLPFFVGNLLELPLTTTQDYSLFNILDDHSIRLWKEQISAIRAKHGLMSFLVHPDYIMDQAARRVYNELLQYLCELRSQGETWIALPSEVAAWWRLRSELKIVNVGGGWRIDGEGQERARLAYAVVVDNTLTYELAPIS